MLVSYQKHIFSHDFDNVCIVNPSTSLGIHLFDFANEFRMFAAKVITRTSQKRGKYDTELFRTQSQGSHPRAEQNDKTLPQNWNSSTRTSAPLRLLLLVEDGCVKKNVVCRLSFSSTLQRKNSMVKRNRRT